MRTRRIGTTDIEASVIAFGAWAVGGMWWGGADDDESIRAIRAAIDAGISLIDTSPLYGFGRSEEVVGRAIRGVRDKVVLATKCGLWWDDARGVEYFAMNGKQVYKCLRPETIRIEVENSLRRLGVDGIDLYQTHWQSPEPENDPIEDTMACLLKLKDEGKIRAIGASNVTVDHIRQYQAVGPLDAIQPHYSMLTRDIEQDVLPHCIETGVSALAYSPMERGLLTGKVTLDREFPEDDARRNHPFFKPENRRRVLDMLGGWRDLTEKHGCTTAQLVLAWTVSQPGLTFALAGARNEKQARENAAAGSIELSDDELARMRRDVDALGTLE